MKPKRTTSLSDSFANQEIAVLAVYLLGGESTFVDTEDVAVKVNELAPGRFTWRKYSNQINLEVIRVYLSDAKKPSKGAYLIGSGTDGWMLSEKGLQFARARARDLPGVDLSRRSLSLRQSKWLRHERARILADDAFLKVKEQGPDLVSQREAQALFRVDDYIIGDARDRKLVRLLNAFEGDLEVGPVLRALAEKVRSG